MNLELVGLDGTQMILDSSDIAALPPIESRGGLMTSAGSIKGPYNYTGVSLTALCDLVGGLNGSTSVRITAEDGYTMVYTYDQVQGDFITFDHTTANEVEHTEPLTPILAYYENGYPISSSDGPIRLVIVGSEGLITEGHYWVKSVVKVEIRPAVKEWTLNLTGAIIENMNRATFESGVNCHGITWNDSDGNTWSGIPLWLLVGRVDDTNQHEDRAFNRTLADTNYTIKVIASDGFSKSFYSTRVKLNDNIILANTLNGAVLPEQYWPLRLVGSDLARGEMVRNVTAVQLIFVS